MSQSWLAYLEDKYRFIRKLGQGATASVYEIEDITTLERFALKIVTIESYTERKRVNQEIMMGMLIKHSNSIKFYESFEVEYSQPSSYPEKKVIQMGIRMQLGEINLSDEIRKRFWLSNYFSKNQIIKFFCSLIDCLCQMQKKGLMHGDLKPANIVKVRESDGTCNYKICDFGCATKCEEDRIKNITGSYFYVSPKIAVKFQNPDIFVPPNNFKDDVYSLGVTILEMINLKYCKRQERQQGLALVKNLHGEQMSMILKRMLKENEEDRPDFIELQKIVNSEIKPDLKDEKIGSNTGKIGIRAFNRDKNYFKLKLIDKLKTKKKNQENIRCAISVPLSPSSMSITDLRQRPQITKKQFNQEQTKSVESKEKYKNAGIFKIESNTIFYAYCSSKITLYFNKHKFQIINWSQKIDNIFACHLSAMLLVSLEQTLIYLTYEEINLALLKVLEDDRKNQKKWGLKNTEYAHYIEFKALKNAKLYKNRSNQNNITCIHQRQDNICMGWDDGHVSIEQCKFKVSSEPISHILAIEHHLLIVSNKGTLKKYQICKEQSQDMKLYLTFLDEIKIEAHVINLQKINLNLVCILQNGFMRIFDGLSFEKSKILRVNEKQIVDGIAFSQGSIASLTSKGSIVIFNEITRKKQKISHHHEAKLPNQPFLRLFSDNFSENRRIYVLDGLGQISQYQINEN